MNLPGRFLDGMKKLMDAAEYEAFVHALGQDKHSGLRVNTLKLTPEQFLKIAPFQLTPVPWCPEGFYYDNRRYNPGRHPYYHAGLYYVQEPSAMMPAKVLNAKPGEKVLDLCAAPGGKTVQLASSMEGKGLLVSNDNSEKRAKALVKNIELSGIRNAVVTVEDYRNLSAKLGNFFDRILVDAPCSGEGMFRKHTAAKSRWSSDKSAQFSHMQNDMLLHADKMLKAGGCLVYSTCTFSPEENECVIARFIKNNRNYTILDILKTDGIQQGRPEWCEGILGPDEAAALKNTARLWPHMLKGEGHFVALLKKNDTMPGSDKTAAVKSSAGTKPPELAGFEKENLKTCIEGNFECGQGGVYLVPEEMPDLKGIRAAKTGWYLGHIKNGKFKPSQSMVMSLKKEDFINTIDYKSDSAEIIKYLKGETLFGDAPEGLFAVCVDGFPLGWATHTGAFIKNLYPSGWRML